ncbi:hypothetical protein G6F65_015232 [Rhizopus arrhizus]|nr:hypothetical protein G6F65_015232 [Rhizopus arrhizus]
MVVDHHDDVAGHQRMAGLHFQPVQIALRVLARLVGMWRLRGAQHLGLIDQQVVLRDGADEGDGGAHFLGENECALESRFGQQGAIHGDEQACRCPQSSPA